jgi:hypothetical protein
MIAFNKSRLRILVLGLSLMILTISCAPNVDSNELFEKETFLKLNIYQSDTVFIDNSINLKMSSSKVKELRNWIDKNKTGWENSIASFAQPLISVIGKDFRMLIFKDFIVIGFTDNKGKPRQYKKQTDFKEFDFLIEEKNE